MKYLSPIILLFFTTSCIPVKIAPRFKNQNYKVIQAKKFKRKLSRETSFIFKDPKQDGDFYTYIETKFGSKNKTFGNEYKINIEDSNYYFSFSETDKEDKTFNIIPVLIDAKLETGALRNTYTSRKGHWYLLITIYDKDLKNCLVKSYPERQKILNYLIDLKKEYLKTSNYNEVLFNKKP